MSDFDQRLRALEAAQWRWRLGAIVAGVLLLAGLVMAAGDKSAPADILRAKAIEVVNDKGTVIFRVAPYGQPTWPVGELTLNDEMWSVRFKVEKYPVMCAGEIVGSRHVMMCHIVVDGIGCRFVGRAIYNPDDPWDSILGEKTALKRALSNYGNTKARTAIWRAYLESRGIQPAGGE